MREKEKEMNEKRESKQETFEEFCARPERAFPPLRAASDRSAARRLPKTPQTKSRYAVWIKVSAASWRVLLETDDLNSAYLAFMNARFETALYDYHKHVKLATEAI